MKDLPELIYELKKSIGKHDLWLNLVAEGKDPLDSAREVLHKPPLGLAQAQFERHKRILRERDETNSSLEGNQSS